MKRLIIRGVIGGITLSLLLVFAACEKEDVSARKLHGDSGIWLLESWVQTEYDINGQVVHITEINKPGEFVFFSSLGHAALSGYRQGLFIAYTEPDKLAYPFTYMSDGVILSINDYGGDLGLKGVFTLLKMGGNKQTWERVEVHAGDDNPFSIKKRLLISIKEVSR